MTKDSDDKPYTSFEDWKRDVAHLKWPTIIFFILVLIVILLYSVLL